MRTEELEEGLSDEENAKLWAEEAQRRDEAWDTESVPCRPATEVFRDARARLTATLG